jgi:GNAT superfamily N-acetyltransferase
MKERVRELTTAEIPALIKELKAFERESCFVKVDIDYSTKTCIGLCESGAGTVFGLFDRNGEIAGGLGCLVGPELSTGRKIAVETFWFVNPLKRGNGLKLVDAFEQWAIDNGCEAAAMIHLADSHPESLKRFYEASGYRLLEMHYIKTLKEQTP